MISAIAASGNTLILCDRLETGKALEAIIKDSVASTVSDHKVLYDHLGSCDMTQYFALLKSLAATNV